MLVFFLACTLSSSTSESKPDVCHNSAECAVGFSCQDQICAPIDCLRSQDCAINEYCGENHVCVEGCRYEDDCYAGEHCLDGQCQSYGCRDAHLDCLLGERCIEQECLFVEPSPCTSCSYADWRDGMGSEQECVIVSYNQTIECDWSTDEGCPDGMSCYPADGLGEVEEGVCIHSYAFFRCTVDVDCPRGFHCAQDIYANDTDVHVCWGDCNYYLSQGWL